MGFVSATEDWFVDSLAEYDYPIYIVWDKKRLVGVAGDRGGLESLLLSVMQDFVAKRTKSKDYRILSVSRKKQHEWVGVILPAKDDRDGVADVWPELRYNPEYHFVITKPGEKPKKRERGPRKGNLK